MNRTEFLRQLEEFLEDISAEERAEALQFYQNYFDDAGVENEQAVIQELGSPEQVARMIKADIEEFSEENGQYTETGYQDERFDERQMPEKKEYRYQQSKWSDGNESQGDAEETEENSGYHYEDAVTEGEEQSAEKPWNSTLLKVVLIIAILLAGGPVLLGMGSGIVTVITAVLGLLAGIVFSALALSFALVLVGIGIMIIGVIVIVMGISEMFTSPPYGIFLAGLGMVIIVVGLVATVGFIKLCMKVYPAIFRWVINLCSKPFHRKEGTVS